MRYPDPTDTDIHALAHHLGELLQSQGQMLALAESCTGGWIAQSVTAVPGSSRWFDRGFITYSNAAKIQMLGVNADTIRDHGSVSAAVAREMVEGALRHSDAQLALAVTGIAGPDGGSPSKPVGLVFLAWQRRGGECQCREHRFDGDRQAVRRQTVAAGLRYLLES